jgi:uncharacterized membrane protein YqiK
MKEKKEWGHLIVRGDPFAEQNKYNDLFRCIFSDLNSGTISKERDHYEGGIEEEIKSTLECMIIEMILDNINDGNDDNFPDKKSKLENKAIGIYHELERKISEEHIRLSKSELDEFIRPIWKSLNDLTHSL